MAFVLTCLLPSACLAQRPINVNISVTDTAGNALGHALILFHADERHPYARDPFRRELRSDAVGKAQAAVDEGWYDVFVSAPGFAPSCMQIHVTAERRLDFRLAIGAMYATDEIHNPR